jgi:membrane fusion protein (multidrug efflux system)
VADAGVQNLDAQLSLQQAEIGEAAAAVAATRASLDFAREDAQRYKELVRIGSGTLQRAQQTQAARDSLTAQMQRDNASLIAAERRIDVLRTARGQAEAQVPTVSPSRRR